MASSVRLATIDSCQTIARGPRADPSRELVGEQAVAPGAAPVYRPAVGFCSSQRADATACAPAFARRAWSAACSQASFVACTDVMLTCVTRNTIVKTYT